MQFRCNGHVLHVTTSDRAECSLGLSMFYLLSEELRQVTAELTMSTALRQRGRV
jgi:hypothetical protein